MHLRLQHLFFAALVISLVSLAYGINYMYFSNCETTVFGERIKFWTGDTLLGNVHSNSVIAIEGSPVFYGLVSTTECDFWRGPGYNPVFHGPPPQFRAPRVEIPHLADALRQCAAMQGTFYSMAGKSYRVLLRGTDIVIYRFRTGVPFDSTDSWILPSIRRRCLFFDGPLEIKGHMTGELSIGTSHHMLLLDNVVYDDAHVTPAEGGYTAPTSTNFLMLAAEGQIKVANTPANGRNDSQMRGNSQPNLDSTSIFITAALYALGESFTFEQQNDADSGYVFQDPPGTPHIDDRGTVYLFGSLAQMRRGYVHRSANQSTGYLKQYRWDSRFPFWNPNGGFEFQPQHESTDTLDFGGVPVTHTVWDTAHIYVGTPCNLGSVIANYPFYATRVPPYFASSFHIPVSFTPPHTGLFSGILYVSTPYHYFEIVLRGRGLPGAGSAPISMDVAPNPFNLTTTLRYTLSEAGAVKITLYDVLGRAAKEIDWGATEPGEHSVQLNANDLASGVYFVRLQAGHQTVIKKIMLLK